LALLNHLTTKSPKRGFFVFPDWKPGLIVLQSECEAPFYRASGRDKEKSEKVEKHVKHTIRNEAIIKSRGAMSSCYLNNFLIYLKWEYFNIN